MPRPRKPSSLFPYFHSSPEVIRLVVLTNVRFPLSLRNIEDPLFKRGIDSKRDLKATVGGLDFKRMWQPDVGWV